MTLIPFPPLEPLAEEGGRELKLGRFPNRRYDAQNGGSSTVRGFGSLSVGATLRISFGVITDQQMADVWIAFDAAQGDYKGLQLPDKFFFGMDPGLVAKIPSTLEWHFPEGGLSYEQAAPGFTKLEPITFVGQLAVQYPSGIWTPPVVTPNNGSWVGAGTCPALLPWNTAGGCGFDP